MSIPSARTGLRIMSTIEGAKGVLVLTAGVGLFALVHRNVQLLAEEFVKFSHLNPARHLPRIFLHLAANLNDSRLWLLAAVAVAYSSARFVEAYGLWHDWKSMKWFAVLSDGIYIPAELGEVIYRFSWVKLVLLVTNVFVVVFIFFQISFEHSESVDGCGKPALKGSHRADPFLGGSAIGERLSQDT
jgi:uncharacterized membrane protein (DUF2068 family)